MVILPPSLGRVKIIRWFMICFCGWLCVSCAQTPKHAPIPPYQMMSANGFSIAIWQSARGEATSPITIFIEGDGRAFTRAGRPSKDPTPRHPIVVDLVKTTPNAYGLARPCQFITNTAKCHSNQYWTTHRFAEEVIDAYDIIITRIAQGRAVNLVGFSGGGAIATILAARRNDVQSLITLAGNLDIAGVNAHHKVPAMPDAINPITLAPKIATIAQIHYSGAKDRIVPPFIAQNFIAKIPKPHCADHQVIANTHESRSWARSWLTIQKTPHCPLK